MATILKNSEILSNHNILDIINEYVHGNLDNNINFVETHFLIIDITNYFSTEHCEIDATTFKKCIRDLNRNEDLKSLQNKDLLLEYSDNDKVIKTKEFLEKLHNLGVKDFDFAVADDKGETYIELSPVINSTLKKQKPSKK